MTKKNYKYTIHGFQQDKLIQHKLTNDDALVASVILSMYASSTIQSIHIDNERYIWVSQRSLHRYIPIIGSEKKLRRIIDGLVDKGLLKKEIARSKDGKGGMYTFVMPTDLMGSLTEYNHDSEGVGQNDQQVLVKMSNGVLVKMSNGLWTKCPNKDTPNNNTSNSNTPNIDSNKPPATSAVESVREENSKPFIINRLIEHGVDKRLAEEYWHYRTTIKRDRPTNRAISLLINECISSNFNISKAIELTIANGWKGFKVQWVQNQQQQAGRPQQVSKREAVEAHNARIAAELIAEIQGGAQ